MKSLPEYELRCQASGATFSWTEADQTLLDRLTPTIDDQPYAFPRPSLSPLERKRRRLAFRNERHLYQRSSSLSGKPIISMYAPDKPFPVFAKDEYWSDACDPRTYGIDYDFDKSFFEQLATLKQHTPRVALIADPDADKNNCAYINFAGFSKNCYMAFNADQNQDCYYISSSFYCSDCVDCSHTQHCEICYECIGCTRCYDVRYAQDCTDCSCSRFLYCCVGCRDCFCCANLVQRQYCIKNVQYSKQDYEAELAKLTLSSRSSVLACQQNYAEFLASQPRRYAQILRSENCSGDYILDSKDCAYCFNIRECRDLRYADIVHRATDCMDLSAFGVGIELVYNSTSIGVNSSRIYCSYACVMGSSNLFYCDECRQSQDCFGCISLKRSQYCILNKQYTREQYFVLLPKIIAHLQETGEWGTFFPYALSPFGYNESVAQERFPLTKEQAAARNIPWFESQTKPTAHALRAEEAMPDSVFEASEELCTQPMTCSASAKAFRISKAEFAYYKKHSIPVPITSPDTRYKIRESQRNPEQLWSRVCPVTGEQLLTTYGPEFSGQVLSERGFGEMTR
jgi:hypothetical protein